jgi:uncharacterized protein
MKALAPTPRADHPILFLALGALVALSCLRVPDATAASPNVVISQAYGGGGNSGSTWKNDFVELLNTGVTSVNVTGWSVQYASATGTTWTVTPLVGVLAPGQYMLIQQAAGGGGTAALPTPEVVGTTAMSATAGKVALVGNSTALSGACPAGGIVDFLGYGSTANCAEASVTAAPNATTAVLRLSNGCTDRDNNLIDFSVATPQPRNSTYPRNECQVVPTSPETWGRIKSFYR